VLYAAAVGTPTSDDTRVAASSGVNENFVNVPLPE
jgi:hypothetical protein